jgi:MoaA/NifB/PqqE/SkfB family radical SAM enzyme
MNKKEEIEARDALILERSLRLFKYLFLHEPQPPYKLILTPTDRCNLNCIFCPNFIARKKQRFKAENELSDEEWFDIIDQGVKLGVRQWCILGGGEPLLRRELILPALEKIKKGYKVLDLEIITNGTLFTEEIIKGIVKVCEEKVDMGHELAAIQITISLHGTENVYKEITGFNFSKNVIENVRRIISLKKRIGLKHPIIQLNIVINKKNLNQVEDLILLLSKIGVDQIALHALHTYEEIKDIIREILPTSEEYKSVLTTVNKLVPKIQNSRIDTISLTSYLQQLDRTFKDKMDEEMKNNLKRDGKYEKYEFFNYMCYEPWYDMLINPDGVVGRCAAFVTRKEPINVKNESIEEIWFGEFLTNVRENVKRGLPMEGCTPCALQSNTIILRKELKQFLDFYIRHDINKLKEIESFLKRWASK